MKLLLVKVLALTLASTTSKDVLAQDQNQNEHVAALRGSVFVQVQGDMFLNEDEDSTCSEIGETCSSERPGPACCNFVWYCSRSSSTCCLGPGQTCSNDSECCTDGGSGLNWSGECTDGRCQP